MSEIHRYQVVTMLSAAGATIGYDQHGPDVVMAAEFDRVTAERDALRNEIGQVKGEYDRAVNKVDTLQARLTAADEREMRWVTALSKIKLRLDAFVEADRDMPSPSVEVCQSIAYAALKPAKMLPADHKCIECESEYCHGVCVERGDSDDRLIE